ncbi:MAG TPA: hypothetical protein VFX49_13290, partial [Chloroflexota bacterium]|nr:hypothetical protein [Chloroflexota bacterium]
MVVLAATAAVVAIALLGTRAVASGIDPWSRFWGITFFAVLIWPIAIWLTGRLAGRTAQVGLALAAVALSVAQQLGAGSLPIPLVQSWYASLSQPGDAVRRELSLPDPATPAWQRAWDRAAAAAIAICTERPAPEDAGVVVELSGSRVTPLARLRRLGRDADAGWYLLPLTRAEADAQRPLVVELRRERAGGEPVRVCGGQTDPARPGWAGSQRRRAAGAWSDSDLADVAVPLIDGRPAPSRYY